MNLPASQLDEAERPRAAVMKFTYPSGSRPLDGYTIKRGVGRGGFGEVYFATSDAGKEVALKLIRRNLEVELRGVTQCLNLKHPNLVGVYDIRTDGMDDQWVIMEYVSGESLEDAIDRHPNGMPVEQVLGWMRGMCAGVAYLHDHGIVHRDLKPGNIFLDEDTVKIGDYGLAKFISCSRRSGQTESVGTVHYMAPEIANGRYGREIDTYALGIILYEMLTGTVPFEGESVGEVLMKHLTAEPDLSRLQEPYKQIVQRALTKDPEARLKSVTELMALLPGGPGVLEAVTPRRSDVMLAGSADRAEEAVQAKYAGAAPATFNAKIESPAVNEIEEPIWKAIREAWAGLLQGWKAEGKQALHPVAKALIVFAGVIGVIMYSGEVMAMALPVLMCYGVYYVVWVTLIRPSGMQQGAQKVDQSIASKLRDGNGPAHDPAMTVAWKPNLGTPADRYAEQVRRRRLRRSWREAANRQLVERPLREKLSELLGSMLSASMFAALAALVAPVMLGIATNSASLAVYLWLALVGTLGSWAILAPTKFFEGKIEDQVPMRIVMLLAGGLVGVAAWLLAGLLIVDVPNSANLSPGEVGLISHEVLGWNAPSGEIPPLPIFVTYFAFLFLVLRWWRQAEFTRNSRLSLWSVALCVGWAWFLQLFWWFPQPAGMMVAGVTAFATQLASPWLPPSRRRVNSIEAEPTA